jgi:hypothetical protein
MFTKIIHWFGQKFFARGVLSLGFLLVLSPNIVSAQLDDQRFDTFNNNACQSVHVVYLPAKDVGDNGFKNYKLFEAEKISNAWYLTEAAEISANIQDYEVDQEIKSRDVLQRFRFGTGNYKKYCVDFQEELPIGPQGELGKSVGGDSGLDLMGNYVRMIYKFGSLFIGLIGVLVMVISGVQITMGGIDSGAYESAKKRIIASIVSLMLLYSSAMILRLVNPGFFT